MPIGPSLPPHLAHLSSSTAGPEQDEEEDDFGPALPPELAAKRTKPSSGPSRPRCDSPSPPRVIAGPSRPGYSSPSPPRVVGPRRSGYSSPSPPRVVGPARPGASGGGGAGPSRGPVGPSRPPASPPDQRYGGGSGLGGEEDDSDDEIGPRPDADALGGRQKTAVEEFMEREKRRQELLEEESKPKKMERQEWMLAPPTGGILGSIDPLRKRPTTFNRTNKAPEEVSHIWTETPAEKAQRLKDEAAGVKRTSAPTKAEREAAAEEVRKRKRDREIQDEVERHNKSSRGPSLLEKHKSKRGGDDEDDKPIWDHARDMGVTGRMLTDVERDRKIKDAKGLNDRFGHSAHGAYSL